MAGDDPPRASRIAWASSVQRGRIRVATRVTALWHNDGSGWRALAPAGFPEEAALHALVEGAPQLLPLSGSPRLVVVGREVRLGSGYADLVAVEPSGRIAVIEVKLASNAEARRAVVAQVLTYAAVIYGLDVETLERDILGNQLHERGYDSLVGAMSANDQEGSFDAGKFAAGIAENLSTGAFRLVLVLDDAPSELVRLVGYLEAVGGNLVIDLVTVTAYDVDGSRIMVPQRVDPERPPVEAGQPSQEAKSFAGYLASGASDFGEAIDASPAAQRQDLRRLYDWAISLEQEGLVRLSTYHGKNRMTLLPYLSGDDAGLVTIWNDNGAYLSVWRSVFKRRAPESIPEVEAAIGAQIGNGNSVRLLSDEVLAALTRAYREAASGLTATRWAT